MLFALLHSLLLATSFLLENENLTSSHSALRIKLIAFIGATWFAIHPVAVYGAGYLAQRTILFATLFSLLCLWFYQRAFTRNHTSDVITAALMYSLAVFSKEHAVMIPFATVVLTLIYKGEFNVKAKRAGIFIILCIPAALTSVVSARAVIGTAYEPYVGQVIPQIHSINLLKYSWGPWVVSTLIQASEFFSYIYYWLIPDTRYLSVDMRIDFNSLWHAWWFAPKALAFFLIPILSWYCIKKRNTYALCGFGLIYCWVLYLTELSSIRFQEPFVLYRSYLWAPGFILIAVCFLSKFRSKTILVGALVICPLGFLLANDRLTSFKSEAALWSDAAVKLKSPSIAGADRIFYNRGGEYFKSGDLHNAMNDLNQVVALNPSAFQGYLGRGKIYISSGQPTKALEELDKALACNPPKNGFYGWIQFQRGMVLQALGKDIDAYEAFNLSASDGYYLAKIRLQHKHKAH
jgi:tetratricopeptide (TPR) repeat protein